MVSQGGMKDSGNERDSDSRKWGSELCKQKEKQEPGHRKQDIQGEQPGKSGQWQDGVQGLGPLWEGWQALETSGKESGVFQETCSSEARRMGAATDGD